jgi:hypothetical protein
MAKWSETIIRCGGNENSSTDEALRKIPKGIQRATNLWKERAFPRIRMASKESGRNRNETDRVRKSLNGIETARLQRNGMLPTRTVKELKPTSMRQGLA